MAKKPGTNPKGEFAFSDVVYEDGSQRSNRRVPAELLGGLHGSIRRECVDHFIILDEAHLRRILRTYARYYNDIRTHRSLDKDAPVSRPVQRIGSINSHAILGGLHHHYVRV